MRFALKTVTIFSLLAAVFPRVCGAGGPVDPGLECADELVALPEPKAVFIDRANRAVLFAVSPADRRNFGVVPPPQKSNEKTNSGKDLRWWEILELENNRNLRKAGPDATWIDVTNAFSPFTRMFRLFDVYAQSDDACRNTFCISTFGHLAGLLNFDSRYPQKSLREAGFVETPGPLSDETTVIIYGRLDQQGSQLFHSHFMVRIPGTTWIIHKNGDTEKPVMIQPMREGFGVSPSRLNAMLGIRPVATSISMTRPGLAYIPIETDKQKESRILSEKRIAIAQALKAQLVSAGPSHEPFFCLEPRGLFDFSYVNAERGNPPMLFDWVEQGRATQVPLRITYAKPRLMSGVPTYWNHGGSRIVMKVPTLEAARRLFASVTESLFVFQVEFQNRVATLEDPRVNASDLSSTGPWRDHTNILEGQAIKTSTGVSLSLKAVSTQLDSIRSPLPGALGQLAAALTYVNGLRAAPTSHALACPKSSP